MDQGGEYLSKLFQQDLSSHGITHMPTATYSPASNGIVERFNRTLLERVRSIRLAKHIPLELWGELVTTITYIYNRTPHAAVGMKTPSEKWSGSKPTISHLKVLWSDAFAHIP
jgi:transposase InsO family protein